MSCMHPVLFANRYAECGFCIHRREILGLILVKELVRILAGSL